MTMVKVSQLRGIVKPNIVIPTSFVSRAKLLVGTDGRLKDGGRLGMEEPGMVGRVCAEIPAMGRRKLPIRTMRIKFFMM